MTKTQVLQVVGSMNCGGAETMIMNIFRHIDRAQFQFHFLYFTSDDCYYDDEILKLGGIIHRVNSERWVGKDGIIQDIKRICRQSSINVVHAHTSLSIGLIMYAAKRAGVPIRIAHSHTTTDPRKLTFARYVYRVLMKRLINRYSNRFFACSAGAGEYLYRKKDLKFKLVPNAIDLNKYDVSEDVLNAEKKALGLPDNTFIIGQVGSFKEGKNHRFSIEIAKEMRRQGISYQMLFAGEGQQMQSCINYSRALNLESNIVFLGNRSDVNILMNLFDVLIMPSKYEGLPVVLVEAQAAGLQCIVSDSISKECDLGLDLVTFLPLDAPHALWVNTILNVGTKAKQREMTKARLTKQGYSIDESARLVSEIYNGR